MNQGPQVPPRVAVGETPFPPAVLPAAAPLPAAPVLSYLATISTPTRVRIVAARCVLWIALLELATLLLGGLVVGYNIWEIAHVWARFSVAFVGPMGPPGPPPAPGLREYVFALERSLPTLMLLVALLAHFLPLLLLVRPIRKGHRTSCIAAAVLIGPLILPALLGSVTCGLIALFRGMDIGARVPDRHYAMFLLLIPLAVGVLLVLLLQDLLSILLWIARNPMVDKPPAPFIPGALPPGPDQRSGV